MMPKHSPEAQSGIDAVYTSHLEVVDVEIFQQLTADFRNCLALAFAVALLRYGIGDYCFEITGTRATHLALVHHT